MEDKEVGELWRDVCNGGSGGNELYYCWTVIDLIIKLVEERAQNHFWEQGKGKTVRDFDEMALRDFGIDPDTFK